MSYITKKPASSGSTPEARPRPLVLLTDPIHPRHEARLRERAELVRIAPLEQPEAFLEAARRASVLIVRSRLPEDLFTHTPRLLGVVRHGSGIDIIPVPGATAQGIVVSNVPGANRNAVAEYCIAAMMDASRRIDRIHDRLMSAGWTESRAMSDQATELSGKRLGIVGLGYIGTRLAAIAHHGFGMQVAAYRKSPAMAGPDHVELMALQDLFAQSDYLCLCCPLNDSTRSLVDGALLAHCQPHAWLVNVARAEVVVQDDLLQRLRAGLVRGATLDTFARSDAFLAQAAEVPGLTLTPHLAGLTQESLQLMSAGAADAVFRILDGQPPDHLVNPDVLHAANCRLASDARA
ncbi:MAG TPA: NAD(P)-dependent oxidoreductase [Burkholderiaceae bacterium]|nr:NAD(P)-dependent oxidoreductase [Burkholderiaceae bacterium]